jgi:hypothetical protein
MACNATPPSAWNVGAAARGQDLQTTLELAPGDSLPVRVAGLPHPSYLEIGPLFAAVLRNEVMGMP